MLNPCLSCLWCLPLWKLRRVGRLGLVAHSKAKWRSWASRSSPSASPQGAPAPERLLMVWRTIAATHAQRAVQNNQRSHFNYDIMLIPSDQGQVVFETELRKMEDPNLTSQEQVMSSKPFKGRVLMIWEPNLTPKDNFWNLRIEGGYKISKWFSSVSLSLSLSLWVFPQHLNWSR